MGGKRLNGVKPCLETPLHLEVLKAREDIRAVIHAHPPYATAFGNIKGKLNKEQVKNYGFLQAGIFTPYADPGSRTLAEIVARPFRNRDVFLVFMEDHGVTVGGPDIYTAYYRLDFLEGAAKAFILTLLANRAL
jgi:L-fuculose-phosphate aldolase